MPNHSFLERELRQNGLIAETIADTMAEKLTVDPAYEGKEELMNDLRSKGLDDRAILDATMIIAYFNFVNRIVLNTGINLEEQHGGYKYD